MDDAAVAEHVQHIADHGYTIVEDAIEPELIDALRRDLIRLEQFFEVEPAANSFEGFHTLRVYNLLAFGRIFELVPVHRHVLPIVEGVLDRGCLISSLSSISIQPGEVAQPIHADDQLIPIPKPHPPTVCNSMWALTDFTEDNGATRIIPGSHLADASPDYGAPYDSMPADDERRVGADLARQPVARRRREPDRRDAHGHRDELLRGLHSPAGEPAARPARETVEQFSPRLRELVGYGVYNMLIGHINKQSPEHLLLDQQPSKNKRQSKTMVWDGI